MASRDATYAIVVSDPDQLEIRDAGDHTRQLTITNDAEGVVRRLYDQGFLGARRLFYRDSSGDIDELRHDGAGTFLGFGPG